MRHWSIKVVGVHAETKQDVEADMFDKVTYILHPSFNDRAKQGQSFASNGEVIQDEHRCSLLQNCL